LTGRGLLYCRNTIKCLFSIYFEWLLTELNTCIKKRKVKCKIQICFLSLLEPNVLLNQNSKADVNYIYFFSNIKPFNFLLINKIEKRLNVVICDPVTDNSSWWTLIKKSNNLPCCLCLIFAHFVKVLEIKCFNNWNLQIVFAVSDSIVGSMCWVGWKQMQCCLFSSIFCYLFSSLFLPHVWCIEISRCFWCPLWSFNLLLTW